MQSEDEPTALSRTFASTETLELAEIHCLDTFCTPIEERFERLIRLGRCALRVPVVAVTAISLDTQWFKSVCSWNVSQLPISESLCEGTVKRRKTIVVTDLSKDLKYTNHPLVVGMPKFRFYAGVPLLNAKQTVIGTLCAMDIRPRKLSRNARQTLSDLAVLAQRELLTVDLHNAQTELISKLSVARRQALLDPLTRTWNRRGGMMLLEATLERAKREHKSVAVCAVDVNDFKAVNDTFGHAAGDRALQMVARELLACVRDSDGVCRFGGDEFFVVIVGATREAIDSIARRVGNRIQQSVLSMGAGQETNISVCIGFEYAEPDSAATAQEMLAEADKALYEKKIQRHLQG